MSLSKRILASAALMAVGVATPALAQSKRVTVANVQFNLQSASGQSGIPQTRMPLTIESERPERSYRITVDREPTETSSNSNMLNGANNGMVGNRPRRRGMTAGFSLSSTDGGADWNAQGKGPGGAVLAALLKPQ